MQQSEVPALAARRLRQKLLLLQKAVGRPRHRSEIFQAQVRLAFLSRDQAALPLESATPNHKN
jgi:hypothetical protein